MQSNIETIETHLQSIHFHCGQEAPKGAISPRVPTVIMIGAHAEGLSKEAEHLLMQFISIFIAKYFWSNFQKRKKMHFILLPTVTPTLKLSITSKELFRKLQII